MNKMIVKKYFPYFPKKYSSIVTNMYTIATEASLIKMSHIVGNIQSGIISS